MIGSAEITMEGGLRTRGAEKRSLPQMPLISVVTVVYNGERHLEQAIRSVVTQSYENVEYIVIDGGSGDGTLEIIGKYEDSIDYWLSEPDNGIYDAMNKGIALARGELIGLLNADDYYEPDALRWAAERYLQEHSAGVYYGSNYLLQEDLNLRYKAYPHMKYWIGMCVCHQAMFVHRDVYRSVGTYDVSYKLAADYDFILRSCLGNIPYIALDRFVVNFRNTGSSSDNYLLSITEAKDIHEKYFNTFSIARVIYLLRYYKTYCIFWLQKPIKSLFGGRILDKIRVLYLKMFYVK
jgi:glycosyltransferase involved in cell wall biosynthesis